MAKLVGNDPSVVESIDQNLETLQPEETFIVVNEFDTVYVKPFTFGKLLKALKYLSNLAGLLAVPQEELQSNILQAFAQHGDDVIGLLMLSTDRPKEYFDELDAGIGVDIAMLTYKVNEDFFVKTLIPKITQLNPSNSPEDVEAETDLPTTETPKPKASKRIGSTSSKS